MYFKRDAWPPTGILLDSDTRQTSERCNLEISNGGRPLYRLEKKFRVLVRHQGVADGTTRTRHSKAFHDISNLSIFLKLEFHGYGKGRGRKT